MPLFDPAALNPGVSRREVFAWSSYDFANSGYTTVVLTAVFNAYFVGVVAHQAEWATLAWTLALSVSYVFGIVLMPAIGAYADIHAKKKSMLGVVTLGCIAATAALAWVGPDDLVLALVAIVISNFCFSAGVTLNSAFLPELARPEALGKVSGWGWSFGYLGGLLALGLCLAYVNRAQAQGLQAQDFVPVTMLLTAAVYAVAALPMFVAVRERASAQAGVRVSNVVAQSTQRTWHTLRHIGIYRDFGWLLVCGFFYQAGLMVVIALAAIYAQEAMHFTMAQTMLLVLLVNITAAIGAFLFGYVQDAIGHRPTLAITIVGWIAMVLIAAFTTSATGFWIAANIAGLCMGSSQSAGRAMVGVFAPADRLAEFYSLWNSTLWLSGIAGPVTYGFVTWVTNNNHRLAILSTGVFFVLGLASLAFVNVERGRHAARSAQAR